MNRKTPIPQAVACLLPCRFACRKTAIATTVAIAQAVTKFVTVIGCPIRRSVAATALRHLPVG